MVPFCRRVCRSRGPFEAITPIDARFQATIQSALIWPKQVISFASRTAPVILMTEHSPPGSFESFLARWQTLGKGYRLRFRMDGAFFKQSVVEVLASRKAEYAIKVPFWQFLDLHSQIRKCRRWTNAGKDVQGFFTTIHIKAGTGNSESGSSVNVSITNLRIATSLSSWR